MPPRPQTANIMLANIVTPEVMETVEDLFLYHAWDGSQIEHGTNVREALKYAVLTIINNVPPCPTRSVAIRKLIEARMDCNAAITHGGKY